VRDLDEVEPLGFHFFASHIAVSHAYVHIVEVGTPVRVGGLTVRPGDLLQGDKHGVINIPLDLAARIPEGPRYFPAGMVSDVPEAFYVAELVREQLLKNAEEELPHSIACRVTEWEWPRIRCEILVERESQKGIVIGKRGRVLKAAGTAVRQQLEPGAYLELFVKVEKGWQRHPDVIERLGY